MVENFIQETIPSENNFDSRYINIFKKSIKHQEKLFMILMQGDHFNKMKVIFLTHKAKTTRGIVENL